MQYDRKGMIGMKTTIILMAAATALTYGIITHADGLIVPLYIDPTAPAAYAGRYSDPFTGVLKNAGTTSSGAALWGIAASGAATIKNAASGRYKDYWVIANGPSNGPFPSPLNTTVKTVFDKVRTNNGKLFGYIHSLQNAATSNLFISLPTVKGYVTAWVNSYPNLDGIFIDEYAPRPEVDGTNPVGYRPTNLKAMANGQINPAGGYYDQLTKWIKTTYPKLKIITNPGGRVYSNQYLWNNLGSVVCSYENTLNHAQSFNEWYAIKQPWGNLLRESVFTSVPQCALIHSNTTGLNGAIDQVAGYGYQYFFTVEASLFDNTWGIMPSYFSSQVQYVSSKP
jgi:hypothetical protein